MRILAVEPYFGGSHQQFLENWQATSRHDWSLLTLPAYKWKWRMRHASLTFADQINERVDLGQQWDIILASDMLNLAELVGLLLPSVQRLPRVIYFHENQLTYPVKQAQERDLHYAFTNFLSALAADSVWFNSEFHRDNFLTALDEYLRRMPDYQPLDAASTIRRRSQIEPPGVHCPLAVTTRDNGPLRIVWNARWEHDKNPQDFFTALTDLQQRHHIDFRLDVIGQSFADIPNVFAKAKIQFRDQIDQWGYTPDRSVYFRILGRADVVVATAQHEFFGMAVVEAMMAGAYPMLPRRLAYPELLSRLGCEPLTDYLYDGTWKDLSNRLAALAERKAAGVLWRRNSLEAAQAVAHFEASVRAAALDESLAAAVG